eukprot:CAMPEP_0114562016 /NCGR_PEP_ID=MMETSP0114-20121206/12304_1 /TAXON_ID=31324 /ORGANISM="Goniomonas sp, Strain m" /LENGTH=237 /DNA_ID=CAMNT_0001747673 /DNA_START=48 /DNA_END=761 /DNA_ORIENTATION=+
MKRQQEIEASAGPIPFGESDISCLERLSSSGASAAGRSMFSRHSTGTGTSGGQLELSRCAFKKLSELKKFLVDAWGQVPTAGKVVVCVALASVILLLVAFSDDAGPAPAAAPLGHLTAQQFRRLTAEESMTYFERCLSPPEALHALPPDMELFMQEACASCWVPRTEENLLVYLPCGHMCNCTRCDIGQHYWRFMRGLLPNLPNDTIINRQLLHDNLRINCPLCRAPVARRVLLVND